MFYSLINIEENIMIRLVFLIPLNRVDSERSTETKYSEITIEKITAN